MEGPGTFILRVYALLLTDQQHIVLAREKFQGMDIKKFPGGGVHFGEGLREALSREIREELHLSLDPGGWLHFYTTDFFQRSAFNPAHQVVSVYFRWPVPWRHEVLSSHLQLLQPGSEKNETFSTTALGHLRSQDFTFPIEQHVAHLITRNLP